MDRGAEEQDVRYVVLYEDPGWTSREGLHKYFWKINEPAVIHFTTLDKFRSSGERRVAGKSGERLGW